MYRELVLAYSQNNQWINIQPPCPESEIDRAEKYVGYPFPAELRSLLGEMNGDGWLLLSAQGIMDNVQRNREIFYPLFKEDFSEEAYHCRIDRFIFFATNGCGDYYCYRVSEDGIPEENAIYLWEHESIGDDCCWKRVADSLEDCIKRYYNNEI